MSNLLNILTEIVEKIEINPNFIVHHPDYPPLELEPETIARFQRTSPQLRSKYLKIQVQNYLHDIYFSHSLLSLTEIDRAAQQPAPIKNNTIDGVDIDFYRRLQQSNTGNGYLDPDWQIVAATENDELIVVKDGLHLYINPHKHLSKDFNQAAIGSVVPIYLPHNLVGRDTYIIVGNLGIPNLTNSVQIYFNFTPDAAVAIAQKITLEFNKLGIPFQFAILHDPALFYRYDAGTLWLAQTSYLEVQEVLANIYQAHQAEFSPDVPLFTKQLAPGLGLAELSATPDTFGMQRCELLATGLLAAMEQDLTLAADKLRIVCRELTTAGIDWLQP
jgi:hypothetical protein